MHVSIRYRCSVSLPRQRSKAATKCIAMCLLYICGSEFPIAGQPGSSCHYRCPSRTASPSPRGPEPPCTRPGDHPLIVASESFDNRHCSSNTSCIHCTPCGYTYPCRGRCYRPCTNLSSSGDIRELRPSCFP